MKLCDVTGDGHCRTHGCQHKGRLLELATQETETAEKWRRAYRCRKDIAPKGSWRHHRAIRFLIAMFRHALLLFPRPSGKERSRRLAVCGNCEMLVDEICTHSKCGCSVRRKAAWLGERCPMEKWPSPLPDPWADGMREMCLALRSTFHRVSWL